MSNSTQTHHTVCEIQLSRFFNKRYIEVGIAQTAGLLPHSLSRMVVAFPKVGTHKESQICNSSTRRLLKRIVLEGEPLIAKQVLMPLM